MFDYELLGFRSVLPQFGFGTVVTTSTSMQRGKFLRMPGIYSVCYHVRPSSLKPSITVYPYQCDLQ
jgi:hypothetical protein